MALDQLDLDLEELLVTLQSICTDKLVSEIGYVYQVNCRGSGEFYMDLKNGSGWVEAGQCPPTLSPDITIDLESKDLLGLILGLATPWELYQSGRVKVGGNVYAATKLQALAKTMTQKLASRSSNSLIDI